MLQYVCSSLMQCMDITKFMHALILFIYLSTYPALAATKVHANNSNPSLARMQLPSNWFEISIGNVMNIILILK